MRVLGEAARRAPTKQRKRQSRTKRAREDRLRASTRSFRELQRVLVVTNEQQVGEELDLTDGRAAGSGADVPPQPRSEERHRACWPCAVSASGNLAARSDAAAALRAGRCRGVRMAKKRHAAGSRVVGRRLALCRAPPPCHISPSVARVPSSVRCAPRAHAPPRRELLLRQLASPSARPCRRAALLSRGSIHRGRPAATAALELGAGEGTRAHNAGRTRTPPPPGPAPGHIQLESAVCASTPPHLPSLHLPLPFDGYSCCSDWSGRSQVGWPQEPPPRPSFPMPRRR
jgi:hypothetical protein